nr:type II toxin-antitoxin system death-on-curing family toxin [Gordonia araii]
MFLDRDAVVTAGSVACEATLDVGDEGLLQSAVARPQSSAFGLDAYPNLWDKAAALMQSLATNHPFVDGNKRTAWAAVFVFLDMNGIVPRGPLDIDAAEQFVLDVAESRLTEWAAISARLHDFYE